MSPGSILKAKTESLTPRHDSRSISKDAIIVIDNLKTLSRRRSRSLSKKRLIYKIMKKLAERPREISAEKHKRNSRYREERLVCDAELSLLTTSNLSHRQESGDQYFFRSEISKSSININPRLLETVENYIRRLIIPELKTLKREEKMQQSRRNFRQENGGSMNSSSKERIHIPEIRQGSGNTHRSWKPGDDIV